MFKSKIVTLYMIVVMKGEIMKVQYQVMTYLHTNKMITAVFLNGSGAIDTVM